MQSPLAWLRTFGSKAAQGGQQFLSLVSPFLQNVNWVISRDFRELATSGYGQNSVVYSCLSLLASSVPEPPLVPYFEAGEKDLTPLEPTHPLRLLLKRPNPFMSQTEFWELVTLYMGIAGRAHFFKERDRLGNVVHLWPLRPDRIGPIYLAEAGDYAPLPLPTTNPDQHVLWGWAYWPPGLGQPIRVPAADIAHFKWADPAGETGGLIEGLGPLQVLNREVEADNEATTYVGSLLKNAAIPGILLRVKSGNVDRTTADRIKRIFASQFGGAKRGEPAVVDGDTEIEQVAFNLQQLEFPDLRSISESRIAAAFMTPAVLVGLKVGLDHATYSNLQQAREYFAESTLATMWSRLADQFTQDIAQEFGANIVCAFDTSVVKALAKQRQEQKAPFVQAFKDGVLTVNEYREKVLDLPPLLAGGDVLYLPPRATAIAVTTGGLAPVDLRLIEGEVISSDTPGEPDDEEDESGTGDDTPVAGQDAEQPPAQAA